MRVHLITSYHFSSSDGDSFARLLRSVRASLGELGNLDRLILVPSGSKAAPVAEVLAQLHPTDARRVLPVDRLPDESRNVIALNAGVERAMGSPGDRPDWVGSVQSSVVVKPGWMATLLRAAARRPEADALFGRLASETDDRRIWADGHYLDEGRTLNVHYDGAPCRLPRHPFPCLSAALFSRHLVESVKWGALGFVEGQGLGDATAARAASSNCWGDL